jgi:ribonucleotide monophosphatase NagD (HAD superfamily)
VEAHDQVIYCFDIDGTLCSNTVGEYERAVPFPQAIDRVNRLHDEGHRIILFTARGTTTGIDWREVTERQMAEWGVHYDELIFGKPQADVYIDDRGLSSVEWLASEDHPA